jgi:hypothetical protein
MLTNSFIFNKCKKKWTDHAALMCAKCIVAVEPLIMKLAWTEVLTIKSASDM